MKYFFLLIVFLLKLTTFPIGLDWNLVVFLDFFSKSFNVLLVSSMKLITLIISTFFDDLQCYWRPFPRFLNVVLVCFSNKGFRESLLENLKGKFLENSDKTCSSFTNTCNTNSFLRKKSILEIINRLLWTKVYLTQLC